LDKIIEEIDEDLEKNKVKGLVSKTKEFMKEQAERIV